MQLTSSKNEEINKPANMKLETPPRNACDWPCSWEEEKDENAATLFDTMFRLMETNYRILVKDDSSIKDNRPDSEFTDAEFLKSFHLDEGRKIFLDVCSPVCTDHREDKQMDMILKELAEPRLDPKTGFCVSDSLNEDISEHFVLSEFLKTCDNKTDINNWQALTLPKTSEDKSELLPSQHSDSPDFVNHTGQPFRVEPRESSLKNESNTQNQLPVAHSQAESIFHVEPITDVPPTVPSQLTHNFSKLRSIEKNIVSKIHTQHTSQARHASASELQKTELVQDTHNSVNQIFAFFNTEETRLSHNIPEPKLNQDGEELSSNAENTKSRSNRDTKAWVQNSTPTWEQLQESSLNFPVKIESSDNNRQFDDKSRIKSSELELEIKTGVEESSNYQTIFSSYPETSSEIDSKSLVLTSLQSQNSSHSLVTDIGMTSTTSSISSNSKPVLASRLLLSTYHTSDPSHYSIPKERSMSSSPGYCSTSESQMSASFPSTHQNPGSEPEMTARNKDRTSMSPNHLPICEPEVTTRSPVTYPNPSPSHCISPATEDTCASPTYPGPEVTCRRHLSSSSATDPESTSKSLLSTFYQALSHSDYYSDDGQPQSIGSLDSVQSPSFSELEMDGVDLEDLDPLDESAFSPLAPSEWLLEESTDSSEPPAFALPPMIPGTRRFDDGSTGSKVRYKLQYNQILEAASGLYPVCDNQAVSQMDHEFLETLPAEENYITINDSELPPEYHQTSRSRIEFENKQEVLECKWAWCGMECVGQEALVRHIETCHVEPKKADQFTCLWDSCLRQARPFNARYKLLIHMRVHSGEKPNKCPMRAMSKDKKEVMELRTRRRKKLKRETNDRINMEQVHEDLKERTSGSQSNALRSFNRESGMYHAL